MRCPYRRGAALRTVPVKPIMFCADKLAFSFMPALFVCSDLLRV